MTTDIRVFTAPEPVDPDALLTRVPVFLGGSIEQGVAWNWQEFAIKELVDEPVTIFNPRRAEWDPSWIQDETNPEFVEQVNWELDRIEDAQIVFLYFQADTMSPISLLELGIVATQHVMSDDNMSVVVVCERGFWRRGNVQIVCGRAGIPMFDTLRQGIAQIREDVKFWSEA